MNSANSPRTKPMMEQQQVHGPMMGSMDRPMMRPLVSSPVGPMGMSGGHIGQPHTINPMTMPSNMPQARPPSLPMVAPPHIPNSNNIAPQPHIINPMTTMHMNMPPARPPSSPMVAPPHIPNSNDVALPPQTHTLSPRTMPSSMSTARPPSSPMVAPQHIPNGNNVAPPPQQTMATTPSSLSSTNVMPTTSAPSGSVMTESKVLDKRRIQELVKEVDPMEQLDDEVEEALMTIADDFIDNVVNNACILAKHRKSNTLDVKDVQLHLERNWNMWVPGFGSEDIRPYKKATTTEAHKQRMALIRKTMKKY